MNTNSASGIDNIPMRFVRRNIDILASTLVTSINKAIRVAEYPDSFKMARLSCIFKAGDPKLCTNYRPIAVLNSFARLFERFLYLRFLEFLKSVDFFHPHQFGFTPNSNTTCATLCAASRIINAIESQQFTIALFVDVSKAFDCVQHEILLRKLEMSGFRGPSFEILSSYLFARRHAFDDGITKSKVRSLRNGVPQGSSLSSLLFLVYINDLLKLPLNGHIQLYADDAMLIYTGHDLTALVTLINNDLNLIYKWFYDNLLSFNIDKTKYMLITPKGRTIDQVPDLQIRGSKLKRVASYKYLGLVIDEHLTWGDQIKLMKSKLRPILAMLRRSSYLLPKETRLSVYYAHIHAHLCHLACIWGSASQTLIDELAVLQRKAIRYVFWYDYRNLHLSTREICAKYKILQVPDLIEYDSIMTIHKIRHSLLQVDIQFPEVSQQHEYHTRRRSHLQVPLSRTNYNRNSILHRGVNAYNSLPGQIRRDSNLITFKKSLKSHLCSRY